MLIQDPAIDHAVLVAKGFHKYDSPESLDVWDDFYRRTGCNVSVTVFNHPVVVGALLMQEYFIRISNGKCWTRCSGLKVLS